MTTDDPTTPAIEEDREPLSFRARTARILGLVAALVVIFLWGWALFFPPSKSAPGTLDDPAFPLAAEQVCTNAAAQLTALPKAFETTDATARADVIRKSNVILTTMVDELDALPAPADSEDATNVEEWLGDWRTYIGDRANYATALSSDPKARFYVTQKDRRQVTEPIDFFARFNEMYNCVTPDDTE